MEDYLMASCPGLCLVERNRPFHVGVETFLLDLVFFHRGLRRLFAVSLSWDEFPSQSRDWLGSCLDWLDRQERRAGEEPPFGLHLDAQASVDAVALRTPESKGGAILAWHQSGLEPRFQVLRFLRAAIEASRALAPTSAD